MKAAFVAPFYGAGAGGGAEAECRQTALHLAAAGVEVDVYTTCLLDLIHDWNVNYHPQGVSDDNGVRVRRFRVDYVDFAAFFRLNDRILRGETLSAAEERQFIAMNVNSFDLYRALAASSHEYDIVCFIPYLFGTTYYGSMLCPDNAVLIPCLHDEHYARMSTCRDLFSRAKTVVFHTWAEAELASRLYGDLGERANVLGEGIVTDFRFDAARFRAKYNISGPFVLYAGRKDATKNIHLLIEYFSRFCKGRKDDLKLVLIGQGRLPVPDGMETHILDLGFVSEQDKRDAHAAASVFCLPSLMESFSIVIMESWVCGVPCLVHGGCAATREHAVRSGGGLYFESYPEFAGCLDLLLTDRSLASGMGAAGRRYVLANFAWDRIVEKFMVAGSPKISCH